MQNDADDPARIEHEIEQDREALRRTLQDLQGELSLDGFTRRMTDQFRAHGDEWASSVGQAARANPVALAVTGVGLAWLIFGRGYDPAHRVMGASARSRDDDSWGRPDSRDVPRHGSGHASGQGSVTSSGGPLYSSGSVRDGGDSSRWRGASAGSASGRGQSGEESLTDKLGAKAAALGDQVSRTGSSVGSSLRRSAHDWRDSIGQTSSSLAERLHEGTDDLGEEARQRVIAARQRALEAGEAASRGLRRGQRAVADSYSSEPLIYGAAAFAIGAGLACLLPRTQQEDEVMGRYSDELFAEAESIFNEEKAKVQKAAAAGLSEARAAASDVAEAARAEITETKSDDQSRPSGTGSSGSGSGGSGSSGTGSSGSGPSGSGPSGSGDQAKTTGSSDHSVKPAGGDHATRPGGSDQAGTSGGTTGGTKEPLRTL